MKSLFSVIIPTFNRESKILTALNSVKAQSYRPIEIVIVDDGSTDGTEQIVRDWAFQTCCSDNKDMFEPKADLLGGPKRVLTDDNDNFEPQWALGGCELRLLYRYQQNAGVAAARNRGFSESSGLYVQFLDSDDCLYSNHLDMIARVFEAENADLVVSGYDVFSDNTGEILKTYSAQPCVNPLELVLQGELVVMPLMITFSRELLISNGDWDTSMVVGEDRLFIERALCRSRCSIVLQDVLSGLRRGSSDHLSYSYNQECRVICEESLAWHAHSLEWIGTKAKRAHISRLLRIALKLAKAGETQLSNRCLRTVEKSPVELNARQRIQWLLVKMGKVGRAMYRI